MAKRRGKKDVEAPEEPSGVGDVTRASAPALDAAAQGEDKPKNWADKPDSPAYLAAAKLYNQIQRAYENKQDQTDSIEEYWNIFNAKIDENQQYIGVSTCYVPEVRNNIRARARRTLKQLFPTNNKHVEAIGADARAPFPVLALLEHYIRSSKLKQVVRADLIAGDVTGQWNLYVDWIKTRRAMRKAVRQPTIVETLSNDTGQPPEQFELDEGDEDDAEYEIKEEEIVLEGPEVLAFATEDLAVVPPTCDDLEKAKSVTLKLRMSEEAVQEMIDDGIFVGVKADELIERLGTFEKARQKQTPPKKRTADAGIRTEGTYKYALIYWTQCNLPLDGDGKRQPAYVYFCGENEICGIVRNPWWSGKRAILSAPIEKQTGSFFGISKVDAVKYMQWNLNDFWNMGQDSAQYSLLPVILTDPVQNPNWAAMVMGLAAVWPVDPMKTKALEFPQLWKDSGQMCQALQALIRESMDVTDSMMGRQPPGRKNAQAIAAYAQDQQVTIEDHAEHYEEAILGPLLEIFFELDQQFRTESLTVLTKGELGIRARMTEIPPQQFDARYHFLWSGTSYIKGIQQMQQRIAWMNVLRGVPPQQLNGRKLDVTPILEAGTEMIFGPEIAPKILIDTRDLMTVDAQEENMMMHNGFDVEVHPEDNDPEHIRAHQMAAQLGGDLNGKIRFHLQKHMAQLQAKRQQQQAQQMQAAGKLPPGQQGAPGGNAPGLAGSPRIGAQPGAVRGGQQPPGAVHPDGMLDPMAQPRG